MIVSAKLYEVWLDDILLADIVYFRKRNRFELIYDEKEVTKNIVLSNSEEILKLLKLISNSIPQNLNCLNNFIDCFKNDFCFKKSRGYSTMFWDD